MLIRTKLGPPKQPAATLSRDHLVDAIVEQPIPFAVIDAPAGYGKTTLLGQCYARLRDKGTLVGWYSADDKRFESEQFFAYIIYALHAAGLSLPYSEQALTNGLTGTADMSAANALLVALEATEEPVRLIIDDYHRIASPAIDAFLAHVVERMPSHAGIILSSRGSTDLPIASLKARGSLLCLHQADLRFSAHEAAAFLEPSSSPAKWARLVEETEGWPAILQLLRMRGGHDLASQDVSRLVGRPGDFERYLAEQVFNNLPEDLQGFLLDIGWLSEVSGGLADALTGGIDGARQLDRLARVNPLVSRVDDEGDWYRLHPLLAEFLQNWLGRTRSGEATVAHARAASWFAQSNMLGRAVEHAAQTADKLAPLRLIEEAKGWRLALQGGLSLLRHLETLPLVHAEMFPRAWLARAYMTLHQGGVREARTVLHHLKERLHLAREANVDPAIHMEILAVEVIALLYEGEAITADAGSEIKRHVDNGLDDPFIDTLMRHLLCAIAYSEGKYGLCQMHGEEALRSARLANMPFTEAYTHQYLGLSRLSQGRVREAEISLQRAVDRATIHFGDGSAALENNRALLGRSYYLAGRFLEARELLARTMTSIERTGGWLDTYVASYQSLAWLHAFDGAPDASLDLLADARRTAIGMELPHLAVHADVWEARIGLFTGNAGVMRLPLERIRRTPTLANGKPVVEDFARELVEAIIETIEGRDATSSVAKLWDEAQQSDSSAKRVEAMVLRAIQSTESTPREAVLLLCEALDLSRAEGLFALVLQFGRNLTPIIAAAQSRGDLLSPPQRSMIADLATLVNPGARSGAASIPRARVAITPREVDVLRALADGLSSKEIARRLGVAESTIKTHRISVYRKLDVTLRSRAIEAARGMGLI